MSANLEDNTQIYDAFRSLGIEQQEEVERLYASHSSTSIFSEKDTTNDDEEFPPHLFDMEKIQKVESCMSSDSGESIVDGYLQLYTDGGCYNNGKENAYGAVGIYFGRGSKLNTSVMLEGKVTNNIAEIRAAYLGLQIAYENGFRKVKLFTDSHYVVMCCSRWLKGWKKNNWKKANGRPVLNKEELEYLDEAISKMDDVQMVFVRGHKGIEGNEYADKLARDCMSASRSDLNKDTN
ncbi:Ribonuclease H1 [Armadillidium nasatum]|uniref:Ribonuclease H1 n=1 Tax=Armadillidium nasatum TaxID=96803 RepID=A0A5N5TJZ6_9CRUS|nr:Ribonuclease H1 [Armadillidium nasatum]